MTVVAPLPSFDQRAFDLLARPLTTHEIAARLGCTRAQAQRAVNRLYRRGRVGLAQGRYYRTAS